MKFISTPLAFVRGEKSVTIARDIDERISQLDKLVELIVFTPRGRFMADPDFGFEYWNHEYSNVSEVQFNSNNAGKDNMKTRCEESVR